MEKQEQYVRVNRLYRKREFNNMDGALVNDISQFSKYFHLLDLGNCSYVEQSAVIADKKYAVFVLRDTGEGIIVDMNYFDAENILLSYRKQNGFVLNTTKN